MSESKRDKIGLYQGVELHKHEVLVLEALEEMIGHPINFDVKDYHVIALYLEEKGLTTLPESIDNLTKLEGLYLYGNPLTALPDSIVNLPNLHTLIVHPAESLIPEELFFRKGMNFGAPPPDDQPEGFEIERYGSVEYYNPMITNQQYSLFVSIRRKKDERVREGMTIAIGDTNGRIEFRAKEPEPVLTIKVISPSFVIDPKEREVTLKQDEDISIEFGVIAEKPIENARITVEFFYKDKPIGKIPTKPIKIREKDYQIDGIQISQDTAKKISLVSAILSLVGGLLTVLFDLIGSNVLLFVGLIGLITIFLFYTSKPRKRILSI